MEADFRVKSGRWQWLRCLDDVPLVGCGLVVVVYIITGCGLAGRDAGGMVEAGLRDVVGVENVGLLEGGSVGRSASKGPEWKYGEWEYPNHPKTCDAPEHPGPGIEGYCDAPPATEFFMAPLRPVKCRKVPICDYELWRWSDRGEESTRVDSEKQGERLVWTDFCFAPRHAGRATVSGAKVGAEKRRLEEIMLMDPHCNAYGQARQLLDDAMLEADEQMIGGTTCFPSGVMLD